MYYPYQLSSQYADRRNQGHKHNHEAIAREKRAGDVRISSRYCCFKAQE